MASGSASRVVGGLRYYVMHDHLVCGIFSCAGGVLREWIDHEDVRRGLGLCFILVLVVSTAYCLLLLTKWIIRPLFLKI